MRRQKAASLLLVFTVMSVLSVLLMHAWVIAGFQCDVIRQRELWYRRFYTTEAFFNVGVGLLQVNFDVFYKRVLRFDKPMMVNLVSLLQNKSCFTSLLEQTKSAVLIVQKVQGNLEQDVLMLSLQREDCLEEEPSTVILQCLLKKVTRKVDNARKIYFVVSSFTIRSTV